MSGSNIKTRLKTISILALLFLFGCSEEKQKDILAKIGDREISLQEFLNRCELTPRPFYCRSGSEKDKKIILNTLILETLFALEEKEESTLLKKSLFNAYIKGRKEQYMREELFRQMTENERELDPDSLENSYKLAGLVYDVEFFMLNDTKKAMALQKEKSLNPEILNSLFSSLNSLEKVPKHTINFKDPEYPSLHHTVYSKKWKENDIIGPVRLRESQYMVLKIKDILYNPAVTQTEIVDRKKRVKESLVEKQTNKKWNKFTSHLMKGKVIEFIPEITTKMAELWAKNFIKKEENPLMQVTAKADKEVGVFVKEIDLLLDKPMLKLNEEEWKVADFKNLVLSHPLVFRKADLVQSEVLSQFKLAVADLIQDSFITKVAYDKNIDEQKSVQEKVSMWENSYLALEHRKNILNSIRAKVEGKTKNFNTIINPYIKKLQSKYSNQIEVNMKLLKSIKLTHNDFVTSQQFVPYQEIVPAFPVLTRNDQMEFGSLENSL